MRAFLFLVLSCALMAAGNRLDSLIARFRRLQSWLWDKGFDFYSRGLRRKGGL